MAAKRLAEQRAADRLPDGVAGDETRARSILADAKSRAGGSAAEAVAAVERGVDAAATLRSWVVGAVASGRDDKVFVRLSGRSVRARLRAADDRGVTLATGGMELPLSWAKVDAASLLAMGKAFAASGGEETLTRFAVAFGVD